jgi:serine/threonine protein kinase
MVGSILADRYRILEKLGDGAMGNVYLGEHLKIGRHDAIKVLRSAVAGDPEAEARFLRGARMVSAIRHPNVCTIYDFGDAAPGLQFLAMEFVPGETLKELLDREGTLPLHRAVEITRQTAEALQAAHDVGIVHRDLKPGNIMIAPARDGSDVVKVVDFDIAKGSDEGEGSEVTRHGFVIGTPEYMSPEQLMGERLDGRSDIYSLAIVLFRALTGELPFAAATTREVMVLRLTAPPRRLDEARPDGIFPEALQQTLDRALQRRADHRQPSAATFAQEIVAALEATPASTPPPAAQPVDPTIGGKIPGTAALSIGEPGTAAAAAPPADADLPPTLIAPAVIPAATAAETTQRANNIGRFIGAKRIPRALPVAAIGAISLILVSAFLLRGRGGDGTVVIDENGGEPRIRIEEEEKPEEIRPDDSAGNETTTTKADKPDLTNDLATTGPGTTGTTRRAYVQPVTALDAREVLDRQFYRMAVLDPPQSLLRAALDTAESIWHLREAAQRDRAYAAYIMANALMAIGDNAQGRIWAERAVDLCTEECNGYQDILNYYRSVHP